MFLSMMTANLGYPLYSQHDSEGNSNGAYCHQTDINVKLSLKKSLFRNSFCNQMVNWFAKLDPIIQ